MKLRGVLVLCTLVFFISCGSKKSVANKSLNKKRKKELYAKAKAEREETIKEIAEEQERERQEKLQAEATSSNSNKDVKSSSAVSKNEKLNYTTLDYINEYTSIAIEEMHKYKIPASITLAQGVLESGSGKSALALKSNNHFGIKCHKGWKGHSVSHDDDALGECFRKYTHPKTSYEDHSKFLTSRSRYAGLFKLKLTDYVGWAYGLKKAGYATDKKYPNKLIAIIKKYDLSKYDLIKPDNSSIAVVYEESVQGSISHTIVKGDTLYSLSRKYNTTVKDLKSLNGLTSNSLSIGQELLLP